MFLDNKQIFPKVEIPGMCRHMTDAIGVLVLLMAMFESNIWIKY